MPRQGKMANTPFHVESFQYRYAVEHDDSIVKESEKTKHINKQHLKLWQKCIYRVKLHNGCKLWFINSAQCKRKQCPYQYVIRRRDNTCLDCLFSTVENEMLICKLRSKYAQEDMGSYCAFFEAAK